MPFFYPDATTDGKNARAGCKTDINIEASQGKLA